MIQRLKNIYHFIIAVFANIFYGFPSRNLITIGVTGTDGKTTTVSLIYHILKSAGYEVSMISTVGAFIGGGYFDVGYHVTTPSAWKIQSILRRINKRRSKGKSYVIIEVTSHALDQYRVWGINFKVGVLTNVTSEHLDYHRTYLNYLNTKLKLLFNSEIAIVNKDDNSYKYVKERLDSKKKEFIAFSTKGKKTINIENIKFSDKTVVGVNVHNITAAVLAAQQLGVSVEDAEKSLSTFNFPVGRQEIVYENDFKVMVDFAHTPASFERLLPLLKPEGEGRLIHVFGSAGERDKVKRPVMGEISARYANVIILTSEDPRSESPEKIMSEVEMGISHHDSTPTVFKISDRKQAIETAISLAKKDDFIVITGKGHETSMNYGKGEIPWSDAKVVKEAVAKKHSEGL